MAQLVLTRAPRKDNELNELVRHMWGLTNPRHKVCPEHDASFDTFSAAYVNKIRSVMMHGSRGLSGKSRLMSILGLTKAAVLGSDVNIVGGSLNQSINIHNTMRNAWENKNAPRYLVVDETATRIRLSNRAIIMPLTASQKTVRGPHPPSLLLDEIDEMDLAIFDASLGQPMPQENWQGNIIQPMTAMTSTWQYPDKTFAVVQERFIERDEKIFRWCYKDTANPVDGWLTQETIELKRREIPLEMWRVEYDLGEPSIGNRAFDSAAVERMFSLPVEPLKQKITKDFEEYRFDDFRLDREYVIGADWAKEQDWTVITVADVTRFPCKVVHWLRCRRRPYPVMIGYFNKLMKEFNASGIHDATGLGGVVSDYLDSRARGFLMTGMNRDNMLSEYISAVENDRWLVPRVTSFYKQHLYCSVEQIYARGKEFHLPDEVCSMALVWREVSKRAVPTMPIMLPATDDPTWIREEMEYNRDAKRKAGSWVVGQVENKSSKAAQDYDLLV